MLRLSQGFKPGRPLARPIDDRHWALIERCWSSISERPPAEDVASCLQQLQHACTPVLPLRDLFGIPPPSHTVPSHPGNDLRPLLIEDADDRAEETLDKNAEAGSSHNNAFSGNTKTRHIDPLSFQEVYAKYLQQTDYGYPLRMPEPMSTLPQSYQDDGLQIGDVGIVDNRGQFDVLFNICKRSDNSIHDPYGVPQNFWPVLPSAVKSNENAIPAGPIYSHGIIQTLQHNTRRYSSMRPSE